jgi:Spy/CpxP family protein refolding chaperone
MKTLTTGPRMLAALLLVFAVAVGFLGGILVDRLLLAPPESQAVPAPAPGPRPAGEPRGSRGPGDRARYLDFIDRELALTAEQRGRIEEILRAQQERMDEITRESRPLIRALAEQTRERIQQTLTPEQQARFEALRRERDRRSGHGTAAGPRAP